jgi:hypothetical protein
LVTTCTAVPAPAPEGKPSIPFPARLERPGISAQDSLAEAGRKVMLYLFSVMLENEPGTRQGEDIEALHDMRVATRRMRAAFEVFGEAFRPKVLRPLLKGLRATGRALGRVRDLDVLMEKALKFEKGQPDLQPGSLDRLILTWQNDREAARGGLEHNILLLGAGGVRAGSDGCQGQDEQQDFFHRGGGRHRLPEAGTGKNRGKNIKMSHAHIFHLSVGMCGIVSD